MNILTITDLTMKPSFLYVQVTNRIQQQIETGVLKPGDKLTSVRAFSKQQGISISTAFKAYEELVLRDLIQARPRSGYFVGHQGEAVQQATKHPKSKKTNNPISTNKIVAFGNQKLNLEGMVSLSITSPDINLLPVAKLNKAMKQALVLSEDSCINYENISGNETLRRHIARQALEWKGSIGTEEIIITHGCIEAIVFSLMTVTKPGDIVIIGRPTYFSIYNVIKNLGLKVLEIDVHPTEGMSLDRLEGYLKKFKVSACVFISNFNNPTGHCMQDEEKEKLVGILSRNSTPLIEDDIYGELYFGSSRPSSCKSFDKKGIVMLCSSFSKTLAPGYRVGWCLPGKFKDRYLEIKLMQTVSSTTPTQAAIAQFFNSGRYDLHMNKLRRALHISSVLYRKAITDYFPDGTRFTNPKGGLALWIELDKKIDGVEVFHAALEQGVSIWPGQIFSASEGFENFIRISFGTPYDKKVENSLKLLGQLARV